MAAPQKRDNAYWKRRLERDGHLQLLARVEAGELTVHAARKLLGHFDSSRSSPSEKLAYHWARADDQQREKFVLEHRQSIRRTLGQLADRAEKMKAQKPTK